MDNALASVAVRLLTEDDVDVCARWVDEHPLFTPYGMTSTTVASSLRAALERGEGLLVAEATTGSERESLLGLAWFLTKGAFSRSGYLRLLLVSERATGGGVGRALMEAVEAAVFAEVTDLLLLVNKDNVGARRFYERLGYTRIGELDDYVGPGLHEYIYRKRLPTLV